MKTAIIKTDLWEDDKLFKLLPDTRYFYLCLLTNPKRNTTRAFKCSDRLLTAYTGYTKETIEMCKQQLIDAELIEIVGDYYILSEQQCVEPKRGKLTRKIENEYLESLPVEVQEKLMSGSRAALEYINNNINNNININNKDNKVETADEKVSRRYYEVVKALDVPVRNHTNLKTKIKELVKEIGADKSLVYLDFVERQYQTLTDDGYKPRINESLDIHAKRGAIKSWIERQQAENNARVTVL